MNATIKTVTLPIPNLKSLANLFANAVLHDSLVAKALANAAKSGGLANVHDAEGGASRCP